MGVLVSALNVRPQLFAKPQKTMRAAPADDFVARAVRTALGRDALMARRSERVLTPTAPPADFLRRALRQIRRLRRPAFPLVASNAGNAARRCSALSSPIAANQAEKSSASSNQSPRSDPV